MHLSNLPDWQAQPCRTTAYPGIYLSALPGNLRQLVCCNMAMFIMARFPLLETWKDACARSITNAVHIQPVVQTLDGIIISD